MMILRTHSRMVTAVLLGLLIAQSPQLGTVAMANEKSGTCQAKPFVVKIHADWCSSCRATQQTWAKITRDLNAQATVVAFDVSDREAYEESVAEAARLGISRFFQEYRSRTGIIAVLHCETFEPVVVLSGERDFGKYRDAVLKAGKPS